MKIQSGQDDAVTVRARKQWRFSGHPHLSGEIENVRLDASSLGLTPLYLTSLGDWDPAGEYWGEEGEPSTFCCGLTSIVACLSV